MCATMLMACTCLAQQTPSVVEPGAPGEPTHTLSPAATAASPQTPSAADIAFMQGMIMHHAQAVEMTELLRTHGANKDVLELGERIRISQADEMLSMRKWLKDHGQTAPDDGGMANMPDMPGMHHASMQMAPMPGMLTPEQMKQLAAAHGREFDRLFLTGMIQHHGGALVMVDQLFATAGAAQDAELFDFVTDVDNTQRAEIAIMQHMLATQFAAPTANPSKEKKTQ
ncbi:DUF305 domain-containing protein [Silvibacterium dinghuense]|uniref:DUF305 domain-containing protein n=2 Tax=Silvibacterium dinghuense TaxID=1560006 RepID=A0A4Q1SF92_9BACT|nr:DUF305 domain-containing protein [Silvibacterium dinghuense]GGH14300.1 lipoprotein [Silvibacterium dinghuense]